MTIGAKFKSLQRCAGVRNQWRELLEDLWPSRSVPSELLWRRKAMLHVAIAAAIALAAGPEIIAALEMTTLLELLGVGLFMTAFRVGAMLALLRCWDAFCRVALPAPQLAVLHSDAPTPAKAAAFTYVSAHAAWCLAFAGIVGAWGHHVFRIVA